MGSPVCVSILRPITKLFDIIHRREICPFTIPFPKTQFDAQPGADRRSARAKSSFDVRRLARFTFIFRRAVARFERRAPAVLDAGFPMSCSDAERER
jgi:hypothetical protein